MIAESTGSVAGEVYVPLGTTDFSRIIESIADSGAELILSTLVGHDEVFFERQCAQHGLRATTRTFALVLDEATQQLIGNSDADGVWAAFGYFQYAARRSRPRKAIQRELERTPASAQFPVGDNVRSDRRLRTRRRTNVGRRSGNSTSAACHDIEKLYEQRCSTASTDSAR